MSKKIGLAGVLAFMLFASLGCYDDGRISFEDLGERAEQKDLEGFQSMLKGNALEKFGSPEGMDEVMAFMTEVDGAIEAGVEFELGAETTKEIFTKKAKWGCTAPSKAPLVLKRFLTVNMKDVDKNKWAKAKLECDINYETRRKFYAGRGKGYWGTCQWQFNKKDCQFTHLKLFPGGKPR